MGVRLADAPVRWVDPVGWLQNLLDRLSSHDRLRRAARATLRAYSAHDWAELSAAMADLEQLSRQP